MKNNSMTVMTSKPFGALNVDVYQNDKNQYYMTREQIGRRWNITILIRQSKTSMLRMQIVLTLFQHSSN